ncbi:MAG: hypothetical protein CXX81_07130 [Methanobacteriota archaeon]|nr:MAG: hypothetical protein CXX81_07130 [Euryarchaeota archaeon]
MPDVIGATVPAGTIITAKRIANRVVSARFIRERISVYGPEFKEARDRYLSEMTTWPTRLEAEEALVAGVSYSEEINDGTITISEQSIVTTTTPNKVENILRQLKMNHDVRQTAVPNLYSPQAGDIGDEDKLTSEVKGTHDWKIDHGKEGDHLIDCCTSSCSTLPGGSLSILGRHSRECNGSLEVYRLGWYAKRGGELLGSHDIKLKRGAINQSGKRGKTEFNDSPQLPLVHLLEIPLKWRPGLYLVKLVDDEGFQVLHPFWVRSIDKSSRRLLVAPALSLQCMNWWGGANALGRIVKGKLKQFTDSQGRFPAISNSFPIPKQHSLGLNRPYYNARGGDVLRWYYPLIRWLEREGIDYDVQTDYDIALDVSLLGTHDQIILSPGMRFWTRSMADGLAAAKVRGADILSLGAAAGQRRISLDAEANIIGVGEKFSGGKRMENPLLKAKDGGWSNTKPWGDLVPTSELTQLCNGEKKLQGMRGNEWDLLNEDELMEGDIVKPLILDGRAVCGYFIDHSDRTWTMNAGTNNWCWGLEGFGQHENVKTDARIVGITKKLLRFEEQQKDEYPKVLVSVVMTAWNVDDVIGPTIEAILAQQHSNLELIIIDDASTDATYQTILRYAERDVRIRLFRMVVNRGTYFAKNFGFCQARGEIVTTQDADDISLPTRILEELNALLSSDTAVAATCDYLRRDPDSRIILNRGVRQRLSYQAMMWKKDEVFNKIGFFDSVRAAADDEFVNRLKLVFGRGYLAHLKRPLYEALDREGSLTNDPSHRAILSSDPDLKDAHLSPPRKAYVDSYRKWHDEIKKGASPKMPFPLTRRKFPVPARLAILSDCQDDTVTVSMASFPARRERMLRVVERILPQVNQLNIYLNDYEEMPPELIDEKITVVLGKDAVGDLRDNGKFYFLNEVEPGFHFTIDDDIEYPVDYIQKMILKIEQYGRHALVGIHGVIFDQPIERFFLRRTVYGFQRNQIRDAFVNLIGTGTLGYHTSAIMLELGDFTETGMADVFIAVRAKQQGVPIICIQRPKGWLEEMDSEFEDDGTLWDEFRVADERQTELVQDMGGWDSQSYHGEFRSWCRVALSLHPAVALAGLGFDITRLMQIGIPESTGPIPVGLKPVRGSKS